MLPSEDEVLMQPDPTNLLERIGLMTPLVGLYDAPDIALFQPLVQPEPKKQSCIFSFSAYKLFSANFTGTCDKQAFNNRKGSSGSQKRRLKR